MSLSKRYALLGVVGMLAWQLLWQLRLAPSEVFPPAVAAGLAVAPMLPAALLATFRRPSAVVWAGVASLLYVCHAITELWTTPELWPLALVELALALWIIFSGNWDGLRAKLFSRFGAGKG